MLIQSDKTAPFLDPRFPLPVSDGKRTRVYALECNTSARDMDVSPLFDSSLISSIWIDNVSLHPLSTTPESIPESIVELYDLQNG